LAPGPSQAAAAGSAARAARHVAQCAGQRRARAAHTRGQSAARQAAGGPGRRRENRGRAQQIGRQIADTAVERRGIRPFVQRRGVRCAMPAACASSECRCGGGLCPARISVQRRPSRQTCAQCQCACACTTDQHARVGMPFVRARSTACRDIHPCATSVCLLLPRVACLGQMSTDGQMSTEGTFVAGSHENDFFTRTSSCVYDKVLAHSQHSSLLAGWFVPNAEMSECRQRRGNGAAPTWAPSYPSRFPPRMIRAHIWP